jgi:putative PIN family toxin of toxin-antitoxin system
MKTVLDANVIVSAAVWGGNPRKIIKRVADGLDTLFITKDIVDELEDVLRRPMFGLNDDEVELRIAEIEELSKKVAVSPEHRITDACRDSDDNTYLECAIAAGADYIITGDKDLLVFKEYGGVKIVNARSYLDIVGG